VTGAVVTSICLNISVELIFQWIRLKKQNEPALGPCRSG
jgi:hypothetical protein